MVQCQSTVPDLPLLFPLAVAAKVYGYRKVREHSMKTLETVSLELPVITMRTRALWIDVPSVAARTVKAQGLDFTAAMHAAHHVLLNW